MQLRTRLLVATVAMLACAAVTSAAVDAPAASARPTPATPRTADGKPDLSGIWGRVTNDGATLPQGQIDYTVGGPTPMLNGTPQNFAHWILQFEADGQIGRRKVRNAPVYKPEYWARIRATDWNYSRANDSNGNCRPVMPRLGAPQKIVQLPDEIIFFYESLNRFRIIPTDGRPRNPVKVENPTWFGDSKGHWDGDTLVIDTVGVTSEGWLGPNGYLRTDDTRITERVSRDGGTLRIDTVVNDPMLLEPWHMDPITARLNPDQKTELWEELICDERDKEAVVAHPHEGR